MYVGCQEKLFCHTKIYTRYYVIVNKQPTDIYMYLNS